MSHPLPNNPSSLSYEEKVRQFRDNFSDLFHGTCSLDRTSSSRTTLHVSRSVAINGMRGDYIFASHIKPHALMYSVRIPEYCVLDSIIPGDAPIPFCIFERRDSYEMEIAKRKQTLIKVNSADFEPVFTPNGFVSEWISVGDIEVENTNVKIVNGITSAMEAGVQIFFLAPDKSRSDIRKAFTFAKDRAALLTEMLQSNIISWLNHERKINPISIKGCSVS